MFQLSYKLTAQIRRIKPLFNSVSALIDKYNTHCNSPFLKSGINYGGKV